ncbi:MAG: hypothetical protein JWN75_1116 [Candidatus Saccharibacteria bacterium]|nr:hypothetical protein [Candidatus Saccharibacteria bacterium]
MTELQEQEYLTREEIARNLQADNQHVFDPEKAPEIEHKFVAHGMKYICSGAGHPTHVAFVR